MSHKDRQDKLKSKTSFRFLGTVADIMYIYLFLNHIFMNINYIKQHCTDLSHDDTIRKKYYRKRFNSLFYIMLGVLFIGVVGMGVMAILSISHNKDYNLIGISCLLPAAFWGVICLHQYAKYDLIIIKQYYREHITQRLINGNWFQRQKEIDRIFFEIRRKSWRDFCTKYGSVN